MHVHITKLADSAARQSKYIIGLMSGTSLDGLDIALCKISGHGRATKIKVLQFTTCDYPKEVKDKIRTVFAKPHVDLAYLTLLNGWLGRYHGQLVIQALTQWQVDSKDIDVIASHGQTIYHCPAHQHQYSEFGDGTLQIADADHIAVTTGITTLSDFRQKHIAAGGEGAPLAHYGDYYYFSSDSEHRILLNMGGIANLTWLPKGAKFNEVVCSDIGAGNTIMDAYMHRYCAQEYDKNAQFALQGRIHPGLLAQLMSEPFINRLGPKTTGPEVFNLAMLAKAQTRSGTCSLSHMDVMATLNAFSARVIAKYINNLVEDEPVTIYASGGGYHNPLLVKQIKEALNENFVLVSSTELGIDPDAKEAVLFAILANEALSGESDQVQAAAQGKPMVTMGKVSFPD
ncbi:anhydro-N-acetylmuramic acid kinase [Pseudoalteromonas sp. MMG012]|uniref:anhydro-N-acetylmuramic acid kinase n=1 Tax=Pseudoalteromonas sp. MMG012 TaxID=2822686 RepID=UPI001B3A57A2|nr:anhydro-N-acetylmuramic acid kinase [Pseudoalteromonas sp. MMG012]MBQ4850204.1 anhydro-N-acetylmuramic acid kinase [Pseudoalteromonas sp. MMG012]